MPADVEHRPFVVPSEPILRSDRNRNFLALCVRKTNYDCNYCGCIPNGLTAAAVLAAAGFSAVVLEGNSYTTSQGDRWDGHFTSRRRTPMATMNTKSGGGNPSTVGPDTIKNAFREMMDDEAKHVSFFEAALKKAGAPVPPKPTFKGLAQSNQSDFIAMSGVLENAGVAAFLMAMREISDKNYVAAAESIVTIEARHAGFVNALLAKPLSENGAFDKPVSQAEIVKAVSPFIESLNGGPDPADALDNDTVILNFALLLEHLEAEFYRINVTNLFNE
jgi:hypothetical protein